MQLSSAKCVSEVACICTALTLSEGQPAICCESNGLDAWDLIEEGFRTVDIPDMTSVAATADCVLLLVQLLAKPANAVVEASEPAAAKSEL